MLADVEAETDVGRRDERGVEQRGRRFARGDETALWTGPYEEGLGMHGC